jgi:hypothetical protein
LAPAQLESDLLSALDRMMDGLSAQQEDELLATLPEPLGVLWVLSCLDFEVTQGSFLAYFYNSAGRHARVAAAALREIGARRMAGALDTAIESMAAAEGEWVRRREELDALPVYSVVTPYVGLSNARRLSDLTDEYWTAADEDDWGERLEAFVVRAVQRQVSRHGGASRSA